MIADLLRSTPSTKRMLAEAVGCTTREVELEIQRLRLATQYATARALRRTARRLEGVRQVSLW